MDAGGSRFLMNPSIILDRSADNLLAEARHRTRKNWRALLAAKVFRSCFVRLPVFLAGDLFDSIQASNCFTNPELKGSGARARANRMTGCQAGSSAWSARVLHS